MLPQPVAGCLLASSVTGLAAFLFALGVEIGVLRQDETGQPRPLLRREGFWLVAIMAGLYLPALGVGSLVDPWETHYGEVAREVLARDDWISLWWSWEGFFYSKPVLGIWLQALSMSALGVHVAPDQILHGVAGRLAHPEWAVRAPFVFFAMGGNYLLYKGCVPWFGRRAALFGALALATAPQWFLVAHQSMTDMPFVAALSGAMGLAMLAFRQDPATPATGYAFSLGRTRIVCSGWHVLLAAVLLCVVPQILYLATRNVELVFPRGFRLHGDTFQVGSALGNCRQPGNPPCAEQLPAGRFEPWVQALLWAGVLATFVATLRRERALKRLLYLGAWWLAAVATMAKGPAGIALPVVCILVWLAATRRWSELLQAGLVAGPLLLVLLVGPWFAAEFVRHGPAFTDELIFHDMFNRTFGHVHDTNAGTDLSFVYYVQQLGYALFPWSVWVPLALFSCFQSVHPAGEPGVSATASSDGATLLRAWFVLAFALFAAMGTKFHHYILPAVPPAAVLSGVALARWVDDRDDSPHERAVRSATALSAALFVPLLARDFVDPGGGRLEGLARFMWLFTYRYDRGWPSSLDLRAPIVVTSVLAVILLVALTVPFARRVAAWAWLGLAVGWAAWGLDVYLPRASPHWGQRAIMEAYYTWRAGPQEPLVAYQMNWKGENFYTGNRIAQFGTPVVPPGTPTLAEWVREQRAHGTTVMYFVTERGRVGGLRRDLQPKTLDEVTRPEDCGQFVLARAEL